MLKLFTSIERNDVLRQLVSFAETCDVIVGTLLVGSGADGFSDEYSDVDVVFVAESSDHGVALDAIGALTQSHFQPIFMTSYQHRPDVVVLCGLLANLLEIDIGVWSCDVLFASSPHWKVVQAQDEKAETRITTSMLNNPPAERAPIVTIAGDDPIWQALYGRYIAEQRRDFDRAAGYTDSIETAIESLGKSTLAKMLNALFDPEQARLLVSLES